MEKLKIIRHDESTNKDNIITISFVKNLSPIESAKYLVNELEQWNSMALSNVKKIVIE